MTALRCLGIDTSNYTTSTALFDGTDGYNLGRLLDVPQGPWACARATPSFSTSSACRSSSASSGRRDGWRDWPLWGPA